MAEHVELSYTLTQREAFDGLRLSGIYKTSGTRAIVETVILAVFCVYFIVSYILWKDLLNLVLAFVSFGVILGVTLVPRLDMLKQSKQPQRPIKLRLYPNKLYVDLEGNTHAIDPSAAKIRLVKAGKEEKLITIMPSDGSLLVIPLRAVPKESLSLVLSLLQLS
jgi:hypothetical protein